jgi:hypothetical protein
MFENTKTAWTRIPAGKRRLLRLTLGGLVGAALGYTYYATVGCAGGGCAISSNPLISTAWGAAMGGLLTS